MKKLFLIVSVLCCLPTGTVHSADSTRPSLGNMAAFLFFNLLNESAKVAVTTYINTVVAHYTNKEESNFETIYTYGHNNIDGKWVGPVPKDIERVIQRINNVDKYLQAGLEQTPNILLEGPPGTGKSLLAQTIAIQTDLPMFKTTGSSFHNKYLGVSAERVRTLFLQTRSYAAYYLKKNPTKKIGAVLFIDEIEGMAGDRSINNDTGASQESSRVTAALLDELTNKKNEKILVIGATNLKGSLDSAVIRTGRFGLHINVALPNDEQRKCLFQHYLVDTLSNGITYRLATAFALKAIPQDVTPTPTKNIIHQRSATLDLTEFNSLIHTSTWHKKTKLNFNKIALLLKSKFQKTKCGLQEIGTFASEGALSHDVAVNKHYNLKYSPFIDKLTTMTDGFTSSDIRSIVKQAFVKSVSERGELFCTEQDLIDEISSLQKTHNKQTHSEFVYYS